MSMRYRDRRRRQQAEDRHNDRTTQGQPKEHSMNTDDPIEDYDLLEDTDIPTGQDY